MFNNAQLLNFGKMVELLTIYTDQAPGKPIGWAGGNRRFSNSSLSYNTSPVWQGNTYNAANFNMSGINVQSGGQIPEPTLKLMLPAPTTTNLTGFLQNSDADIRGCRVVRRIMHESRLDGGGSPIATANDLIQQEFYIVQVTELTRHQVTFKLSVGSGIDSLNDKVNRTLSTNQCNKKYRVWNIATSSFNYTSVEDGGCEWGQSGENANFPYCSTWGTPYFDANDESTSDPAQDRCSLSVNGCKKRFPITNGDQPFPISINLKGNLGV